MPGRGMTGNALTSDGSSRTQTSAAGGESTGSAGSHSITTYAHYHSITTIRTPCRMSISINHTHNVVVAYTIPAITLDIQAHTHTVSISSHTHNVSIPAHTHDLTLADHTHEIVYGIYEGDTASSVTLKVDGNVVPASALTDSEMDIVAYLDKG